MLQETALLNAAFALMWTALRFPGLGSPIRDWAGAPPVTGELTIMAALSLVLPRRGGGTVSRGMRAALLIVTGLLTWWPTSAPQPFLGVAVSLIVTALCARLLRRPWWRQAAEVRPALRELSRQLPDWRLTGSPGPVTRELLSPAGQTITLAVAMGREQRRGEHHDVRWTGATEGNLRRAPWRGTLLLWVHVARPGGDYEPQDWDDLPGHTLIASPALAAQWMNQAGGGAVWPSAEDNLRAARVTRQALAQLKDEEPSAQLSGLLITLPHAQAILWPHPHDLHADAPHSRVRAALQARHPEAVIWAPLMSGTQAPWPHTCTGHARQLVNHAATRPSTQAGPRGEQKRSQQPGAQDAGQAPHDAPPPQESRRAHTPAEILGLGEDQSPEAVRAAYAALAKRYHPDRLASLGDEFRILAEARMKEINAAYAQLRESRDRTQ